MIGWPVELKCCSACACSESSQHPTWPHVRHTRSSVHVEPIARQSSQPLLAGVTSSMSRKCSQNSVTCGIPDWRRRDCRTSVLCVDDPAAGERPVLPLGLLEYDHHVVRMQARRRLQAADDIGENLSLDFDAATDGKQDLDEDEIVGALGADVRIDGIEPK